MGAILEKFKKGGTLISFDTASWDPAERWYESIRNFSSYLDYFFANSAQMYKLTGFKDMDRAAEFLMKDNVKNVIVKLGADGCAIYGGNEVIKVDGYPVDAVDTTGAGDSFDAAYLIGIIKGWDSYKCAKFANIAAGLNCTKLGATAGIPSFEETMSLL
jgi:sugar/nucleoside kinase (ribokinase family)